MTTFRKVYTVPDFKIGNTKITSNRTIPNYVGVDRQKVPKGQSADEFNDYVNRQFMVEREQKDYFKGSQGWVSKPDQWKRSTFTTARPLEKTKVSGGGLSMRGGDRYPFQSIIDPAVLTRGMTPNLEETDYPTGNISVASIKATSKVRNTKLNWRTS
jgi:hypothetical protein